MKFGFKVSGIRNAEEAHAAIGAGAFAVGLAAQNSNQSDTIPDSDIVHISQQVRAVHGNTVWRVLLTGETHGGAIADHVHRTGVNTVQICNAVKPRDWTIIRAVHPSVRIIQTVHVASESAIETAREADQFADILLLDSSKASSYTGTSSSPEGASDMQGWSISRRIVEATRHPVLLAGALTASNIDQAIAHVRPAGVDISAGLRDQDAGNRLIVENLEAFAAAVFETPAILRSGHAGAYEDGNRATI